MLTISGLSAESAPEKKQIGADSPDNKKRRKDHGN